MVLSCVGIAERFLDADQQSLPSHEMPDRQKISPPLDNPANEFKSRSLAFVSRCFTLVLYELFEPDSLAHNSLKCSGLWQ